MENVRKIKTSIRNRSEPCKCGCGGADPWHARKFIRVITIDREGWEKETGSFDGLFEWGNLATGTARFPWGIDRVRLAALKDLETGKVVNFGWERDSNA